MRTRRFVLPKAGQVGKERYIFKIEVVGGVESGRMESYGSKHLKTTDRSLKAYRREEGYS